MNVEEFLDRDKDETDLEAESASGETASPEPEELDVQKAVVEELASDKARLDEKVASLESLLDKAESEVERLKSEVERLGSEAGSAKAECERLKSEADSLRAKIAEKEEREFDLQERNPNSLALLDRDVELPDRFPGETRDQVLDVIREARDKAEAEGRVRRAQVLEGVLVANEPNGNLAKKRAALEKFFKDNGNILSGPVIDELQRCGIPYRNGEEYLLPSEILQRMY